MPQKTWLFNYARVMRNNRINQQQVWRTRIVRSSTLRWPHTSHCRIQGWKYYTFRLFNFEMHVQIYFIPTVQKSVQFVTQLFVTSDLISRCDTTRYSSVNNQQPIYQQAHYWTQMLTSLVRVGAPGLVINAIPLHTTAVSSTNTHSGKDSSGGNSITSKPSSRRSRTYASCWRFASSSSISPLVRNDNGMRHTTACVYFHDAILWSQTPHFV